MKGKGDDAVRDLSLFPTHTVLFIGRWKTFQEGNWRQFKGSPKGRNTSHLICSPGWTSVFFAVDVCTTPHFWYTMFSPMAKNGASLCLSPLCALPGLGSLYVPEAPGRKKSSSGCQAEGTEASGGLWWRERRWILFHIMDYVSLTGTSSVMAVLKHFFNDRFILCDAHWYTTCPQKHCWIYGEARSWSGRTSGPHHPLQWFWEDSVGMRTFLVFISILYSRYYP